MPSSLLLILSILGYLCASLLIIREIRGGQQQRTSVQLPTLMFATAVLAVLGHIGYAITSNSLSLPLNTSLSAMSVSIGAILMIVFLCASVMMPIQRLGAIVYPFTAISLVFAHLWNSEANYITNQGLAFNAHILVSIVAYSLLTLAAIQALLFFYQERLIKKRAQAAMLMALPPLQTMELLLFRLLAAGFFLLTLTLLSGAIFSQQIFAQAFEFKHHTVLALLGWLVFAILLYKRSKSGLRGSQAVVWTLVGFALIQLGYFGTKVVSESLNIQ